MMIFLSIEFHANRIMVFGDETRKLNRDGTDRAQYRPHFFEVVYNKVTHVPYK